MNMLSVVALGMMGTSVVVAQMDDDTQRFNKLDINGDGYVDMYEAEVNTALLEQFTQLDTNGDGKLSAKELAMFEERDQ